MRVPHHLLYGAVSLGIAAVLLVASSDAPPAAATGFSPTLTVEVEDTTPGAHSDITYVFEVDEPDANFQDVVTFLPPEFGVAADDDVPDGAIAGELSATVTLGLLNGACITFTPVEFIFQEATTDLSTTVNGYNGVEDLDGNGLLDSVERYPQHLQQMFPGVQPVQRLYGQALVAGVWNYVNFLVFEPGTPVPFFPELDPALGYATFAILNDPLAPLFPNAITDFCSPLNVTTTVYGVTQDDPSLPGDDSGYPLRTNPADGSYSGHAFMRSLWEADDDGIENNLDPCPYDSNPGWDPRAQDPEGDTDRDGIPDVCDPEPNTFSSDYDGDQFLNRHDLCPLVPDGAFDRDVDDVGDACDRDPDDPADGGLSHRHTACDTSVITIGAGGAAPPEPPCPDGPDLPSLELAPLPTVRRAGEVVTAEARVRNKPGVSYLSGGLAAVTVDFVVTGANEADGSCLTDSYGTCSFNYLAANVGVDTITASIADLGVEGATTIELREPPANDAFADATNIEALPYSTEVNVELSTTEAAEPYDCGPVGSVWYTFTPQQDTFLKASLVASQASFYESLGVYEGEALESLSVVRCAPQYPGGEPNTEEAYFLAEAGETYNFGVSASIPFGGDDPVTAIHFSLEEVPGVVGDLNCDGAVGPLDSLLALRIDAGLPVTACPTAIGDTNCDGVVGVLDSLRMLIFDAGRAVTTAEACPAVAWSRA